ncbi:MAG: haloalkane dehalogenase [Iphinoe sp. HA4291-MV1]|nr:haloalkane dehalogenase [Iphinoe sp. HA4291-MV1]
MNTFKERYPKQHIEVLGRQMAYIDVGQGSPILFLHGNPTSSYLWRNVLPQVEGLGRLIVPDLIGMGDSEKLPLNEPDRYRFVGHSRYLDAFLNTLNVKQDVVIVGHDWGGALGFHWANQHRSAIRGIVYMETFVRPLTLSDLPESFHSTLKAVRSQEGERLVLEQNIFIEQMLPSVTQRHLTQEEMAEYRRPYLESGESRRPTLTWPREVPLDGYPSDVTAIMQDYSEWLLQSDMPKLFINAEPGVFIRGTIREFCRTLPNQTEVTITGMHFLQEDAPKEVGRAIAQWYCSYIKSAYLAKTY